MVTVMLVDDHPVIRRGVRGLLEKQPDFQIVGETSNGFEAVQMIQNLKPDIAVLDLVIEGISGIEVAKQINNMGIGTATIIFSVLGSEHYVLEALHAGVKGYILKESPIDELIQGMREVSVGHRYLSPSILNRTIDIFLRAPVANGPDSLQSLTPREREVLYLSAQGKTCTEMAEHLFVSRRTVEAQRASMMHKLGVKNQHELISYAFRKGIIQPEQAI